jgi:hypothetical protein
VKDNAVIPGTHFVLLSSHVAGFEHHDFGEKPQELDCAAEYVLVHEPENSHDANALAIWSRDKRWKIGYVPARGILQVVLLRLVQHGHFVRAYISPSSTTSHIVVDYCLPKGNNA